MTSDDGRWQLGFVPEAPDVQAPALDGPRSVTLVLGDDAEWAAWNDGGNRGCMGNAVAVRVDFGQRSVQVWSSITGLPELALRIDWMILPGSAPM